jgi:hypothetical protein
MNENREIYITFRRIINPSQLYLYRDLVLKALSNELFSIFAHSHYIIISICSKVTISSNNNNINNTFNNSTNKSFNQKIKNKGNNYFRKNDLIGIFDNLKNNKIKNNQSKINKINKNSKENNLKVLEIINKDYKTKLNPNINKLNIK